MELKQEDRDYLVSLQSKDISINLISEIFGDTYDKTSGKVKPSRIKPTDTLTLKAGECMAKESVKTTAGRVIFNKIIIQPAFNDQFGYINMVINKGGLGKLEEMLSQALMDDKITTDQMMQYFDHIQWLGANANHILTPSFTMGTLTPLKNITDERDQLLKKNADKIAKGDVLVAVQIEGDLTKKAKAQLKNDPGMDLFNSGARGSFENNYKNTSIMKGAAYNPIDGKFEVIGTNFMESIDKEHMHLQGNAIIAGSYPKAVNYRSRSIEQSIEKILFNCWEVLYR